MALNLRPEPKHLSLSLFLSLSPHLSVQSRAWSRSAGAWNPWEAYRTRARAHPSLASRASSRSTLNYTLHATHYSLHTTHHTLHTTFYTCLFSKVQSEGCRLQGLGCRVCVPGKRIKPGLALIPLWHLAQAHGQPSTTHYTLYPTPDIRHPTPFTLHLTNQPATCNPQIATLKVNWSYGPELTVHSSSAHNSQPLVVGATQFTTQMLYHYQ